MQRRAPVLRPRADVGPGGHEHPHDLGLSLDDGDVQRRPAALALALDGAGEQAGIVLDGAADLVDVAVGDQPAQALDGHAGRHAAVPFSMVRSRPGRG